MKWPIKAVEIATSISSAVVNTDGAEWPLAEADIMWRSCH